jgi:hypothetical protein
MLVVLDEQQQGELQLMGGMTDPGFRAFNNLLVQMTGLSVHERTTTLKKLTEGTMPNFTVSNVEVIIKGKKVKRQMMVVDRITDVLCRRIVSLVNDNLLKPTSEMTDLDDDTIMVHIQADKGGTFMASKIGLTVMNCVNPNSVESFDMFASLDAPDSYYNWKLLISKYKEELELYYNTKTPPNIQLFERDEEVLAAFVCNISDGSAETVWEERMLTYLEMDTSSEGKHYGGPYYVSKDTEMELLSDNGKTWGIRLVKPGGNEEIVRLRMAILDEDIHELTQRTKKLDVTLGGDIKFINTFLGLQSCSASFPCNLCLIARATLKEHLKNMESADPRTKGQHNLNLKEAQKADSVAKQKERAKTNNSVICEPLIPADQDQVLLAVLHIILGITKKIWDLLVLEVQSVDDEGDNGQHKLLIQVRDMLLAEADCMDTESEAIRAQYVEADKNRGDAWRMLSEERLKEPYNASEVVRLTAIHKETNNVAKEMKKVMNEANKDKMTQLAIVSAVKEINTYMKDCHGKFESVLENVIGLAPILAWHNPFYSGSFNGNDCLRLMRNHELLFEKLRKAAENEEQAVKTKIEGIAARLEDVFAAWAKVIPLLRTTQKLEPCECATLINSIAEFWDSYIDDSKGSITIKIHMLVDHVEKQLNKYGTIGLFVEDSVESIHALVNIYNRRYAALDPEWRATQVMRVLEMQKKMSAPKRSREKEAGKNINKKRKREQGNRECDKEVHASVIDPAVKHAAEAFVAIIQSDAFEADESYAPIPCNCCRHALLDDVSVPTVYMHLHNLLCHVDVGTKFVPGKKQKRD